MSLPRGNFKHMIQAQGVAAMLPWIRLSGEGDLAEQEVPVSDGRRLSKGAAQRKSAIAFTHGVPPWNVPEDDFPLLAAAPWAADCRVADQRSWNDLVCFAVDSSARRWIAVCFPVAQTLIRQADCYLQPAPADLAFEY